MSIHYQDSTVTLHAGNCLDVLAQLPDASVDAVVTDPPYGLSNTDPQHVADTIVRWVNGDREYVPGGAGFMGRPWDAFVPPVAVWDECLRVLKPGGHALVFAGSRTVDLMTLGLRLAGFEIRDSIAWMYGSGFPKSLDVSKAIDKAAGAEREVVGPSPFAARKPNGSAGVASVGLSATPGHDMTAPATPDAARWQGFGTALKPAFEPVVVARKPLAGTVAANVLAHGTGALNIDACRIDGQAQSFGNGTKRTAGIMGESEPRGAWEPTTAGRWPANVALDEHQATELDQMSGETAGKRITTKRSPDENRSAYGTFGGQEEVEIGYDDAGGASRFFFTAREDNTSCSDDADDTATTGTTIPAPSAAGEWSNAAPVEQLTSTRFRYEPKADASERVRVDGVAHPTVKPLALMRWLVRLITPPGGVVLEPFAGSGTTVEACILEGFQVVAIERETDYLPLVTQRIHRRRDPVQAVKAQGEDGGLFDLLGEETA